MNTYKARKLQQVEIKSGLANDELDIHVNGKKLENAYIYKNNVGGDQFTYCGRIEVNGERITTRSRDNKEDALQDTMLRLEMIRLQSN